MDFFIFFFMILETTRYTRYPSYRQHKGDTMKVKSKLYLQIRIKSLFNYRMEKNLFVNVEYSPVKHVPSRFFVKKMSKNPQKILQERDTWMD